MAKAPGRRHSPEAVLQKHLEKLQLTTPQQKQLTVDALCRGLAARDPAWVDVLVQVVSSAPRAIQQQLAALPGLLKDLAAYVAHTHLSSDTAGAPPGGAASSGSGTASSSDLRDRPQLHPPASHETAQQQQRKGGGRSNQPQAEAAVGALARLLGCCEASVPPPPYQDLAPALHAALQQRLVCLPALAEAILHHHTSHMVTDQQLMRLVLEAAEQGQAPAAAVLALLAPQVFECLPEGACTRMMVHDRISALLAGGTAAGATFLAAALQQEGALFNVPRMVEVACSGLLAACRQAAATAAGINSSSGVLLFARLVDPPPAHAVCLQYLQGRVGVALHLASLQDTPLSTLQTSLGALLVPALAETLSVLLAFRSCGMLSVHGHGHHPANNAAWAALLRLSECPGTARLVAALLQQHPGLLEALTGSWGQISSTSACEEPAGNAARLAACLLLRGGVPGQEERRQQEGLLVAAVGILDRPECRQGRVDLVMELLHLPQGPKAVAATPSLLDIVCDDPEEGGLGPEQAAEAWALLLASPDFTGWLLDGLQRDDVTCVEIVEGVFADFHSEHAQLLLSAPGLGDALAQCCSKDGFRPVVDQLLGDALLYEGVQELLLHQPQLLQALLARLCSKSHYAALFWDCLIDDDVEVEWLLQQPVLLDGVVAALVAGGHGWWTGPGLKRLLGAAPSSVCESLLRQPCVWQALLRALGLRCRQQQPLNGAHASEVTWPQLLLEGLAGSQLAPRAMALLPGLLAVGDAQLSAGVFEAMNLMQRHMVSGSLDWGAQLAATSSRGAAVLCAEEQLAALRQGVEQVQRAAAVAAAATRQLQEQQPAAAGDHLPQCNRRSNRRLTRHSDQLALQQLRQGVGLDSAAAAREAGSSSSQRKSRGRAAAEQQGFAGAGSQAGAGGRLVLGKASATPAAAADVSYGGGGLAAEAPRACKRARH